MLLTINKEQCFRKCFVSSHESKTHERYQRIICNGYDNSVARNLVYQYLTTIAKLIIKHQTNNHYGNNLIGTVFI